MYMHICIHITNIHAQTNRHRNKDTYQPTSSTQFLRVALWKETYQKDLQKRPIYEKIPTKETYKRGLQKRPTKKTYEDLKDALTDRSPFPDIWWWCRRARDFSKTPY